MVIKMCSKTFRKNYYYFITGNLLTYANTQCIELFLPVSITKIDNIIPSTLIL